jgi:hypothetical protein
MLDGNSPPFGIGLANDVRSIISIRMYHRASATDTNSALENMYMHVLPSALMRDGQE